MMEPMMMKQPPPRNEAHQPAKQPAPHPTMPRRRDGLPDDDKTSVAGEEDPGSADEELREHRPGRDSN
jgi:hypothetical protein